jgi:8-oxo-dGTP pyrophosphatase MutT (NUDIX family)
MIEPGETSEEAVRREAAEEIGVGAGTIERLTGVLHRYAERSASGIRMIRSVAACG